MSTLMQKKFKVRKKFKVCEKFKVHVVDHVFVNRHLVGPISV
jgi:hypothetical protein